MRDNIFERTRHAYQAQHDDEDGTRDSLHFACGFLMGADLPGAAAAVAIAMELAWPDRALEGHMAAIKGRD